MKNNVKIHQLGSSILRQISKPVNVKKYLPLVQHNNTTNKVTTCVNNLIAALDEFRANNGYGRGIAANQVGQDLRIVVLNLGKGPSFPIFNPEITYKSKETFFLYDDCLSLDNGKTLFRVERHKEVKIKYIDMEGIPQQWNDLDMGTSELLQHEIDHLNGVLSIDHATNSDEAMEQNVDVSKIKREEFEQRKEFYKRFVDDYVIVPTI
eukprot:g5977.t1